MRILVRNPNSGDGVATCRAARLAETRGFDVRDSTAPDETRTLATAAARHPETTQIAACGGDGTLNEVVRGVADAGALNDLELGVVPTGTGNDFADNVGINGVEQAFDVLADGERRRLDVGWLVGDDRPFLNSCVGGLTAESSAKTTPAAKRRLGVLAYVLRTLAETRSFEGLELDVHAGESPDEHDPSERNTPKWSGRAIMLLVGNGRRFPGEQRQQANMEDGLLNVVIIEHAPTIDYLSQGAADRLLRRDASYLTRLRVPRLHVRHAGEPAVFSLDGETIRRTELTLRSRRGAMQFCIGEGYDPTPSEGGESKAN